MILLSLLAWSEIYCRAKELILLPKATVAMEKCGKVAQTSGQENADLDDETFLTYYSSLISENIQLQMDVATLEAKVEVLQRSFSAIAQQCQSLQIMNATLRLKLGNLFNPSAAEMPKQSNTNNEEQIKPSDDGLRSLFTLEIASLKSTLKRVLKEKADQTIEFNERLYIQQEEIDDLKSQLQAQHQHLNFDSIEPLPSAAAYVLDINNKCCKQHTERKDMLANDINSQQVGLKRARTADWESTSNEAGESAKNQVHAENLSEKHCALKSVLRSKIEGFRNGKHKDGEL